MKTSVLFFVLAVISLGQVNKPATKPAVSQRKTAVAVNKPAPTPKLTTELTIEQVIKLVQAKLSEDLIIAKIKKNNKAFDLSADQLIELKNAGASDNIIRLLMDPQAQPVSPVSRPAVIAPISVPPASTTAPAPAVTAAVPAPAASPQTVPLPDEQGIYWLKNGKELVRMEGIAVSNIRTGSTLASNLTAGIKRARINAQLKSARSEFRIKERLPQFYFYLPEGINPGDYLLLKLAQRLDVRQIEIGQQTFWKKQVGVDHAKEVEFSYKRIKNRLYLVTPNHELGVEEYGFYTTAGGVSVIELKRESARVYDFGVDP